MGNFFWGFEYSDDFYLLFIFSIKILKQYKSMESGKQKSPPPQQNLPPSHFAVIAAVICLVSLFACEFIMPYGRQIR